MGIQNSKFKIQNKFKILKFGFGALFFIWILSFGFLRAGAQAQPEFMVTWKSDSYVPADYKGRVFPSHGSKVDVSFDVVDGGKIADLSRIEIRWFLENQLQTSALGLKSFSFTADRSMGDQKVKISVMGYKGGNLSKTINIPLVNPEVVISSSYQGNLLSSGPENLFQALIYFFNVKNISQLNFVWSANGVKTRGEASNPDVLNLNTSGLPAGEGINLGVEVKNPFNPAEIASKSINLQIK